MLNKSATAVLFVLTTFCVFFSLFNLHYYIHTGWSDLRLVNQITDYKVSSSDDRSDYGIILPGWTSKVYPTRMARVTSRSFIFNAYNDVMKKLKGGPLLKKILDDSGDKITKRSAHQLYAYAGHDSTVSNLLIALGVWDEQIPTYNMLTLIELHERTGGKFYFKVFLRNASSTEPYRLRIPMCKDDSCTFEHVLNLTANVIPADLNEECKTDDPGLPSFRVIDRGP